MSSGVSADDLVVMHEGVTTLRYEGLEPDTDYRFAGIDVHTLPRPDGELLCRFATVNDVHFGEVDCGRIDDNPAGPIRRVADGESPYPETMNHAAAHEIEAAGITTLFAKGDLSAKGTASEWAAFETCYRNRFGNAFADQICRNLAFLFDASNGRLDLANGNASLPLTMKSCLLYTSDAADE